MNNTAFKVVNGLIEITENITVEGYDEYCDAHTFAGATPAEITTRNGVTRSVQGQFDDISREVDVINTELDL